jgi:hypothetical protein
MNNLDYINSNKNILDISSIAEVVFIHCTNTEQLVIISVSLYKINNKLTNYKLKSHELKQFNSRRILKVFIIIFRSRSK